MSEFKKYAVAYNIGEVNELHEKGYRLHSFETHMVEAGLTEKVFIMSLQEPSKYMGTRWVMRMALTHERQSIPEGWTIIHHTAKEVVLIEKGEDPLVTALKEWYERQGNDVVADLDAVVSIVEDYGYGSKEKGTPSTA